MAQRRKRKSKRTQEERRRETQAAILAASIDLLVKEGYGKFSASKVAARARVSRGAQEHYFPTKNKLIAATIRQAMTEAVAHAKEQAQNVPRSVDSVERFLSDSQHFFFSPVYRAMLEIMFAARSEPALARLCNPIVLTARVELNKIWTETLRKAGYGPERARHFVELTHCLLRGLFVIETWLPYEVDRKGSIAAWREIAPAALEMRKPRGKR